MSGKRKSEMAEEPAKKPKLNDENSVKLTNTRRIPDVVWQQIFGFFSLEEIKLNVALVCRHFYEISNDCVQRVVIDEKIFASEHKFDMFNALSTFKYLKSIKIKNDSESNYTQSVDYFVLHSLKNCPRLRHLEICDHEFSIGLINQIVNLGQNLTGLQLGFGNTDVPDILSPLITRMKNLKHLGLCDTYVMALSYFKAEDVLALVENCKELNSLHLSEIWNIENDTIFKLINLKHDKLKHLYLNIFPLSQFSQCSHNLNIFGTNYSELELAFQALENCSKLESLVIINVTVTKSGFEAISKLKYLKSFQLGCDSDEEMFYDAKDVIEFLSIGKLKKLETLKIHGIRDSMVPILMCTLAACPNLKFFDYGCIIDQRKEFPQITIKVFFENLPELRELKLRLSCNKVICKPIFVKSDLEEIFEKCKNKFEVDILSENEYKNCIKITREM